MSLKEKGRKKGKEAGRERKREKEPLRKLFVPLKKQQISNK